MECKTSRADPYVLAGAGFGAIAGPFAAFYMTVFATLVLMALFEMAVIAVFLIIVGFVGSISLGVACFWTLTELLSRKIRLTATGAYTLVCSYLLYRFASQLFENLMH